MKDHQDKGWVNISLLVGKSGKPYGVKDTYKPKEETKKEPLMDNDLPF
jgi:hypothetical protein